MSSQRLQKVLAQAGVASRRAAEVLITEGRVRVNGRIVRELGARANLRKDRVEVDGRRLVAQRHVYFLMHKPRGVVTTLDDPEGRKTVKDSLGNINERVFPVGRLDFQTSGALLLTNDGDLAQALLHPTRAVPKTYNAKLEGKLDAERLNALREGVTLDDGHKTAPAEVKVLRTDDKATSVEITISEGKNRQIHRMGEAIARAVLRLTRLSFAGLTLEGLRPGQLRQLTARELTDLKETYLHKAPKRRKGGQLYGAEAYEEASGQLSFSPGDSPEEQSAWGSEEEPSWGDEDGGTSDEGGEAASAAPAREPRAASRGRAERRGADSSRGNDAPQRGKDARRGGSARRGPDARQGSAASFGSKTRRGGNARRDDEAKSGEGLREDDAQRNGQIQRRGRTQGSADPRNDFSAQPRKTRGASPRNEYGSQARKTRGAAGSRNEYGSQARKTRGAGPRNEYGSQARKTRGADTRNEYGSQPRKQRGADPRSEAEYGSQPRKTRGADARNEYGSQPRKTRGADARNDYGSQPRKTRGADPRKKFAAREGRAAKTTRSGPTKTKRAQPSRAKKSFKR